MPAKVCSHGPCPNLQPCPDHQRKPWSGSARDQGQRISGGRRQARARYVLNRDDTICHVCGRPGGNEVDHIIALAHGGTDTLDNLAPIHGPSSDPTTCHGRKTARESQEGQRQ